jgi:hypothetical protein
MGGGEAPPSRPKLSRRYGWRVNDELISILIERRRRLNATNEEAMTEFCLRMYTENLARLCKRVPLRVLFGCAVILKTGLEENSLMTKRTRRN